MAAKTDSVAVEHASATASRTDTDGAEHTSAGTGDVAHYDAVVIGGGGGLTAAWWADRAGKRVALIEERPDRSGGTCVNVGCIPTKGLVQAAEAVWAARGAGRFGVHIDPEAITVDFQQVMRIVRERRTRGMEGTKGWIEHSFTPYWGRARFVGEKLLEMDDGRRLTGDHIFISTGARPSVPPIPGLEDLPYLTNETVFDLEAPPERLIILGGGYIGVEFGHFFSAMGTEVVVIESQGCLLREDHEVRSCFTKAFRERVELHNNHRAKAAIRTADGIGFLIQAPDEPEPHPVVGDAILVAVGRVPNTDGLGLETTGVETNERGWIEVDDRLRTSHPDIFAYGDVIGQRMFKHMSSREGEHAWFVSQGDERPLEDSGTPHAVFSWPELASVGLTEEQCVEQGIRFRKVVQSYDHVRKGEIVGSPPGLAKLLLEKDQDRILGFHMVGPGSADLVFAVTVAMQAAGENARLVQRAVAIHPTMTELIRSVFDAALL